MSKTVPLDDYLPYVLPDVPGCPEIAALGALQSAVIEFCERSLVYQRDHDPVTVIAKVIDYDLEAPKGYLVYKVMKAWYKGQKLEPCAPDDMDDPTHYNSQAAAPQGSAPTHFTQKDERTISLWRTPSEKAVSALTMRVALKPQRKTTDLDPVFFEDWVDVIAAGAKAALQTIPSKPFSNAIAAGINQSIFNTGINKAMVKANKGNTRANLSVRMIRI